MHQPTVYGDTKADRRKAVAMAPVNIADYADSANDDHSLTSTSMIVKPTKPLPQLPPRPNSRSPSFDVTNDPARPTSSPPLPPASPLLPIDREPSRVPSAPPRSPLSGSTSPQKASSADPIPPPASVFLDGEPLPPPPPLPPRPKLFEKRTSYRDQHPYLEHQHTADELESLATAMSASSVISPALVESLTAAEGSSSNSDFVSLPLRDAPANPLPPVPPLSSAALAAATSGAIASTISSPLPSPKGAAERSPRGGRPKAMYVSASAGGSGIQREPSPQSTRTQPTAQQTALASLPPQTSAAPPLSPSSSSATNNKNLTKDQKHAAEYNYYLMLSKKENFSDMVPLNIVYVSGKDREGRPIVIVAACNIPQKKKIDLETLFLYTIHVLDPIVEQDYVLVYCHSDVASDNKPSFSAMRRIYGLFNRKYKKNLKNLYIVNPGFWIKMTLKLFKPFISSKFWKKLHYCDDPLDVFKFLDPEQCKLPDAVLKGRKITQLPSRLPPVFGVTIAESINARKPREGAPLTNDRLPNVVEDTIEILSTRGLLVDGIFRIAGTQETMNSLKKMYDRGDDVDLHLIEDVHVIAGLLKMWLRELPEPVIPLSLYKDYIRVMREPATEVQWKANIKGLLACLPPENRRLLQRLSVFLKLVAANSQANRMTTHNLGICFGPSILRPETETIESAITDIPLVTECIARLINYSGELF